MNETAITQNKDTKVPLTKKESHEAESFRISIMSKEIASAFWRKNHPVKK
jgi:uncharacterized protein (DUF736 family)